jgi:hypothetical protein
VQIKEDYGSICRLSYYEGGVADGAIELAGGGGDASCVPVVVFAADDVVVFDGFSVTGIPHILDSVVFTGLSFDNGLLGSHIASLCSGVNDNDDEDDVSFT